VGEKKFPVPLQHPKLISEDLVAISLEETERQNSKLDPRVSHFPAPWNERGLGGSLAPGAGKMRDPGNEVEFPVDENFQRADLLLDLLCVVFITPRSPRMLEASNF